MPSARVLRDRISPRHLGGVVSVQPIGEPTHLVFALNLIKNPLQQRVDHTQYQSFFSGSKRARLPSITASHGLSSIASISMSR